jgi:thiosulfate/3-mercaptopyruvate sulfurtransferase
VPPAWLAAHRDEVVVADVRWYLDGRSGRAAHEGGHLPGAVFVDLDAVLAGPPSPAAGRHPLPDPADFAAGLAGVGIGDGSTVVAYDDAAGTVAARLVWLLRAIGHEAALLDGGLAAWEGPLEPGPVTPPPAVFTPTPWPGGRLAGIDEAATARVLVDARAPERFRGDEEPVDPRAGHVPGAVNLPTRGNLDDDGRFLPPEALRDRYAAAGVGPGAGAVVGCGSGVTACHDLLALERAGVHDARLWPGSWSQWSADPDRPVATGP